MSSFPGKRIPKKAGGRIARAASMNPNETGLSKRDSRQFKHGRIWYCTKKGCDRSFKSINARNEHIHAHAGSKR